MPVFALWSAPRARSTAFFRSMAERGDMIALHEPLEGLVYFDEAEVAGRPFNSPESLVTWLRDGTDDVKVFLKETTEPGVLDLVSRDRRFMAEARHAFLIRPPTDIAASLHALVTTFDPPRAVVAESIGIERLYRLYVAVRDAGGHPPVVIDSDDLVDRPAATMTAYCAAVGLPFMPSALTWEAGERPEWKRSARWHRDVSVSTGFERTPPRSIDDPDTAARLAQFAADHAKFFDLLQAQRLDVSQWA